MRRLFGILAILLILAVPALSHLGESFLFLPQIAAREMKVSRLWPRVQADLDLLKKSPVFSQVTFEKNAEELLSHHIAWEGVPSAQDAALEAKAVNDLLAKYPYWKSVAGQMRQVLSDPDGQKISTDWVDKLKVYDHWSLAGRTEFKSALTEANSKSGVTRLVLYSKAPLPDFADLRRWTSLHALRKKDVSALKVAARLAHSTSTLIGAMTAVELFNDARELCQLWNRADCDLPSPEAVEAYKRLSWAWGAIIKSSLRVPLTEERIQWAKPEYGACANAAEIALTFASFQDLLAPHWPLESNYSEELNRYRGVLGKILENCHLQEWSGLLEPTDSAHRALAIPYLRRIYGLELLTLSIPDFPKAYETKK